MIDISKEIKKINECHYAFYAHLQPGSLRVKVGSKVKKGQLIGLLGNSDNSSLPHVHFLIGDRNSLNGSRGLPFVFETFVLGDKKHKLDIPMNITIVGFYSTY